MLETEDVRQAKDYDCGAAAMDTAFRLFGIRKSPNYFRKMLGTNGYNGTDPRTMEYFVRNEGFKVLSGDMEVDQISSQTRFGRPVILMVTLHDSGHYIVARGVSRGRLYYQDPLVGRKSLPVGQFEDCWVDGDRFGFEYRKFGMVIWK